MKNKNIYTFVGIVLLLIIIIYLVVAYTRNNVAIKYNTDNTALVYKTASSGAGASGSGASGSGTGDGYVNLTIVSRGEPGKISVTNYQDTLFSGSGDGTDRMPESKTFRFKAGQKVTLYAPIGKFKFTTWHSLRDEILPCPNPRGTNINMSDTCSFIIKKDTTIGVLMASESSSYLGSVPYGYLDSKDPNFMDISGILMGKYTLGLKQVGPGELTTSLHLKGTLDETVTITESPDDRTSLNYFSLYFLYRNAVVNLKANPPSFAKYGGVAYTNTWYGACSGTGLTCTVTMNGNKNVTSQSRPSGNKKVVYLNFASEFAGPGPGPNNYGKGYKVNGVAASDGAKIPFYYGASVTVTHNYIETWGGACSGTPKDKACTLTMDSNKEVSSTFIYREEDYQ